MESVHTAIVDHTTEEGDQQIQTPRKSRQSDGTHSSPENEISPSCEATTLAPGNLVLIETNEGALLEDLGPNNEN